MTRDVCLVQTNVVLLAEQKSNLVFGCSFMISVCVNPSLFSIHNMDVITRCFEVLFRKLCYLLGLVRRAAEHIQVDCAACICKVC